MSAAVHISEPLSQVMREIKVRMENRPVVHLMAYCDGAAEPNPGPLGAGYVLQDGHGHQIEAKGFFCGYGTNNEAEYTAAIKAIEAAIDLGVTRLDLYTDSMLVVCQVNGMWNIKAEHLKPYREKVLALLRQIPQWNFEWIPRERNEQADTCSKNAVTFRADVDYSDRKILGSPRPKKEYATWS